MVLWWCTSRGCQAIGGAEFAGALSSISSIFDFEVSLELRCGVLAWGTPRPGAVRGGCPWQGDHQLPL